MITKDERKKILNIFAAYDNLTFLRVVRKIDSQDITFKELQDLYKAWRKEYMKNRTNKKNLSLDEFAKMIASSSKNNTTSDDVKMLVLLKKKQIALSKIYELTGLTQGRIYYIFSIGLMYGIFERTEKGKIICTS
ncbi:MAG: hypothetical protein ACRC41_07970 [Sarcina sp.]